jgi:hypothetical protein
MADVKISDLVEKVVLDGTEDLPIVDGTTKRTSTQSVVDLVGKFYMAHVTQSGTSAPVETAGARNTLGDAVTWARTTTGVFTLGTVGSVFPDGKTIVQINGNGTNVNIKSRVFATAVITDGTLRVSCFNASTLAASDDFILDILIIVFP